MGSIQVESNQRRDKKNQRTKRTLNKMKPNQLRQLIREEVKKLSEKNFDAQDTALNFSNTAPNTPPGATAGVPPTKHVPIQKIIKDLEDRRTDIQQIDTADELYDYFETMINLLSPKVRDGQNIKSAFRKIYPLVMKDN